MKIYNPKFRLFLFTFDTLFILSCIYSQGQNFVFKYVSLSKFLLGLLYAAWMFCFLPFLAAMSLGSVGTFALKQLAKGANCLLNCGALGSVFLLNTFIMQLLLSHEYRVLGMYVDVLHLHFLLCSICFLTVYRKLIFGKRAQKCCVMVDKMLRAS